MPDASIDSIVTDPPYELGFMGKKWDASGIAYNVELWRECLRVLKPGGHLLAFGGTRTYHRMAVAIEDAGFEIRDSLHWCYGSGFPKSLDVSKAIDKAAGKRGDVVGERKFGKTSTGQGSGWNSNAVAAFGKQEVCAPATDAARQWSGWGTALKPAHEPIVVARKPLSGTVAGNVLAYGTGALNIDGCRVGSEVRTNNFNDFSNQHGNQFGNGEPIAKLGETQVVGRWPANLVFTHAADCCQVGTTEVKASGYYPAQRGAGVATGFGAGQPDPTGIRGTLPLLVKFRECQPDPTGNRPSGNGDGTETVAVWRCADGFPVAELDGQSGVTTTSKRGAVYRNKPHSTTSMAGVLGTLGSPEVAYGDTGGASRFFTVTEWDPIADVAPFRYVAKPSKRERNAGLDGLPVATAGEMTDRKDGSAGLNSPRAGAGRTSGAANTHPTVKPVALMRWLVRLVTPPGGTVLDPFAGSGTTLVAATLEGFDAIGIEMTDDYLPIIEGRVAWAEEQAADTTPTLFDDAGQGAGVGSL
jgi:hypothetical protein